MAPTIPTTFDDARRTLTARPVGRIPLGIRSLRLAIAGAGSGIDATAPVGDDLFTGLFLDLPDADVAVSAPMLRDWGISLDAALAESFRQHGGEQPRTQRIEGAVLVEDRSFASYLLRTPGVAEGLVGGRMPMIVAPTQGALVVAPADDAAAVLIAARIAERVLQTDDSLVSATALARSEGRWVPYEWPATARQAAGALGRRFLSKAYAQQRPLLQERYAAEGKDFFVPEAGLYARPDGTTQLVTSLTEGTVSVLPWVDTVALVRLSDGAITYVPMTQLANLPGVLSRVRDVEPAVYGCARFPSELLR